MAKRGLHLSQVTSQLYIGDRKAADDWTTLQAYRITHVVRACGTVAKYSTIKYHFCTMKDSATTLLDDKLPAALVSMKNALQEKDARVLMHCAAGRSRSPMIVMAYLIQHGGMNVEQEQALVAKARPTMIVRPHFIAQLRTLESPQELPLPTEPL